MDNYLAKFYSPPDRGTIGMGSLWDLTKPPSDAEAHVQLRQLLQRMPASKQASGARVPGEAESRPSYRDITNLAVETSAHTPVTFCGTREECTRVRASVSSKYPLIDGHPRRPRPIAKRQFTLVAHLAGSTQPAVPTYTIETSTVVPGLVTITLGITPIPIPTPIGYASAGLGDIGLYENNVGIGTTVALSGVTNPAFSNTNVFNKWWRVVAMTISSSPGGIGSTWSLIPFSGDRLRVGDFLQARYFSTDTGGQLGPMNLRIVALNPAWCSWVLESTNIEAVFRYRPVRLRFCYRTCHVLCPRAQTGSCDAGCRLPQVTWMPTPPSQPYSDRTFDLSHLNLKAPPVAPPRPKPAPRPTTTRNHETARSGDATPGDTLVDMVRGIFGRRLDDNDSPGSTSAQSRSRPEKTSAPKTPQRPSQRSSEAPRGHRAAATAPAPGLGWLDLDPLKYLFPTATGSHEGASGHPSSKARSSNASPAQR